MRSSRTFVNGAIGAAVIGFAIACGSSPDGPTAPEPTGCTASSSSTTITISNNAACPQAITVSRGTQVTFVNNDSRAHEMNSDPHPEHTDCPELNQVGHLESGQRRQSGNLNIVRRCGFHDHINDTNAALKGTITIQ